MDFSVNDFFYICNPQYISQQGTYSLIAVRKEIVHLNRLDELANFLNTDKQEGAHLLLIPTKFYMQEYLECSDEYYVCVYVQYWG